MPFPFPAVLLRNIIAHFLVWANTFAGNRQRGKEAAGPSVQEAAALRPVLKASRSRGCPWGRLVPAALVSSMKTSQERMLSFLSWLVLFSVPRPFGRVFCGLGLAGFWCRLLGVFRPVRRAARDAVPGLCRPLKRAALNFGPYPAFGLTLCFSWLLPGALARMGSRV